MSESQAGAAVTAALFLDFDNVYSSLRTVNAAAAEAFARDPTRWLEWFQDGGHESYDEEDTDEAIARPRRVVVRRCYLNPAVYSSRRAAFVRSGFSVIDCPSLTAQGKSSADIYMVMDIMDSLHHKTFFEEFIILTSDADFTPVLLRLREHVRTTTIIGNATAAAALKAACDYVVPQDTFIEQALGLGEVTVKPAGIGEQPVLVPAPRLFPAPPAPAPRAPAAAATDFTALKQRIAAYLREAVAGAERPLLLASLGVSIPKTLGSGVKTSNWCGCGSLTDLITELAKPGAYTFVENGPRSYIYDPARQAPLRQMSHHEFEADLADLSPELREFIERTNKSVGLPRLRPADYQFVAQTILAELRAGFTGIFALSAQVRDQCQRAGRNVSRTSINFILTGLSDAGFPFAHPPAEWPDVARTFRDNALTLCRNAQVTLTEEEVKLLDAWLTGAAPGEPKPAAEVAAPPPG